MRGVAVRELLTRLVLLVVSSTIALYAVETYLELHPSRTKLEMMLDLRRRGVEAYPAYSPSFRLKVPPGVTPLSGVRLVTTVLDGDSAPVLYDSDEFGFRNPPGLWGSPLDIAILGDSFAQGYGAPAGTDVGSVIRRTHPRTLNLGMTGTGQLAQLAIAREFVARLRPRQVVVLYFEGNDVLDTANELFDPGLGRYYFDDAYSQHLADEELETDRGLRDSMNLSIALQRATIESMAHVPVMTRVGRFVRLQSVTALLSGSIERRNRTAPTGCALPRGQAGTRVVVDEGAGVARAEPVPAGSPLLEDAGVRRRERLLVANVWNRNLLVLPESAYAGVLHRLRSVVEGSGGRLYFAYLPSIQTARDPACDPDYDAVRELVRSAGIPFIDVAAALRAAGDLDSLILVHLTPKGIRVAARSILAEIARLSPPAAR